MCASAPAGSHTLPSLFRGPRGGFQETPRKAICFHYSTEQNVNRFFADAIEMPIALLGHSCHYSMSCVRPTINYIDFDLISAQKQKT